LKIFLAVFCLLISIILRNLTTSQDFKITSDDEIMMVTLLFLLLALIILPPPTLQQQSDIEDVEVEAGLNSIVHNISSTLNVSFLGLGKPCELADDEIQNHLQLYSQLKKLSEEGLKVRYKLDVRQGHLELAVLQDLDAKVCDFITDPPLVCSKLMKCETCSGINDEELEKTCSDFDKFKKEMLLAKTGDGRGGAGTPRGWSGYYYWLLLAGTTRSYVKLCCL
jgi:hypothetical protein